VLFNSLDFAVFLPIVFAAYWLAGRWGNGAQNLVTIAASYFFYAWWDWRFLSLIAVSSLTDYLVGLGFARVEQARTRRLLLVISLTVNLGLLGFFKYFGFFVEAFTDAFSLVGRPIDGWTLNIVLPVGISFYTFQTLSYTIDVYRRRVQPTRDLSAFFAYVSFFPQLVAGPIERASTLLPQFFSRRTFDQTAARGGLRQMLWGLFKKVVIADTAGVIVASVFASPESRSGWVLLLGVVLFSFQIYGDFSGYSDIAIGCARLFGISLRRNFAYPYFSRDIPEFWRRWHISLSTWFRDYLYIPIGGNRGSRWKRFRNVIVVFTVSGLWHGADWTFVVWGLIHGLLFLPSFLRRRHRRHLDVVADGRLLPKPLDLLRMTVTFALVSLAWIPFRADGFGHALVYAERLVTTVFSTGSVTDLGRFLAATEWSVLVFVALMIVMEWWRRRRNHGLEIDEVPVGLRWTIYLALLLIIIIFGRFERVEFIYFQF
jgi:D-alanyl-lipoteichoic acid acyltransferase DltB (MBOAT superfamily)